MPERLPQCPERAMPATERASPLAKEKERKIVQTPGKSKVDIKIFAARRFRANLPIASPKGCPCYSALFEHGALWSVSTDISMFVLGDEPQAQV
jgi:hypothetical protein